MTAVGSAEPVVVTSGESMRQLGERLARDLRTGDVVLLHGDLGAGKTTLVQGLARGLGVTGPVTSPTFGIASELRGLREGEAIALHHLDLYRLSDAGELAVIGFERYLDPEDGITAIEWPERAGDWLPERFVLVRIELAGEGARRVLVSWHGMDGTRQEPRTFRGS